MSFFTSLFVLRDLLFKLFFAPWTFEYIAIDVNYFVDIYTYTVVVEPAFTHFAFNHIIVLRLTTETVLDWNGWLLLNNLFCDSCCGHLSRIGNWHRLIQDSRLIFALILVLFALRCLTCCSRGDCGAISVDLHYCLALIFIGLITSTFSGHSRLWSTLYSLRGKV